MYPFLRLFWQGLRLRSPAPLALTATHESRHVCWPIDLDPWRELNNGRALTLYDLGRVAVLRRTGMDRALAARGWGIAVAGASVRYRRRVKLMNRVRVTTRIVCWDARFLYFEQAMWLPNGDCASHILLRLAVTGEGGIVAPADVLAEMGHAAGSPAVPGWIAGWIAAESARPWPPMREG